MNIEVPVDKDASELVFASLSLADRLTLLANERLEFGDQHQNDQGSVSSPGESFLL